MSHLHCQCGIVHVEIEFLLGHYAEQLYDSTGVDTKITFTLHIHNGYTGTQRVFTVTSSNGEHISLYRKQEIIENGNRIFGVDDFANRRCKRVESLAGDCIFHIGYWYFRLVFTDSDTAINMQR